jgi:organic radical activating enzyme
MSLPLCPAIDVGLYLETNGDIKTCCSGNGALGNIKEQPLEEIFFYSKKFLEARESLNNHQFPEYCNGCTSAEKVTPGQSQYTSFTQNFTSTGERKLKHIDLRWSNVCNLNCRYCSSQYSSSWEKLHGIKPKSANRDYHASILEEVKNSYDSLQEVFLLGGEPLLQKQNEELIKSLRDDVKIFVFTNLSIALENNTIYKLLKEKSQVTWYVSFENVGDRFEYVRAGADWNRFVHNFNLLAKEKQKVAVIPVYSIWSATRLMEYYDFISQYAISSKFWRYAQPAYGLSGQFPTDTVLPDGYNDTFKKLAIEQIELVTKKYDNNPTLLNIKKHLENDTPKLDQSKKFLAWTAEQEAVVPTTKPFSELWPEIYASFTE